jgi:uncharacterized membrane protein
MIITAVALVELLMFLALANAAFAIFTIPGAIIFCGIIGGIAVSAILGIMRLFRLIDRRDFLREYVAALKT